MAKLSKTARASGATGKAKSHGPARGKAKAQVSRRARKGARCPRCARRMKRGSTVCHACCNKSEE
jgi:hypothetical protein